MVLQDKYKARASRRYQAKHGGGDSTASGSSRGGARGRGRGGSRGRGRGRGGGAVFEGRGQDGDENSDEEEEEEEDDYESDEDEDDAADQVETSDGTSAAAGPSSSSQPSSQPSEHARAPPRSKYSKRKLTSNAWRFEHPSDEEEPDPDAEPEPEVDLSKAFEKARIDQYEADQKKYTSGDRNNADDDDDIDTDLAYLHQKAANRARGPSHSHSSHQQQRYLAERPDGYEEAQKANRQLQEKNDAKMKIWGKLDDDLQMRKSGTKARPTGKQDNKKEKQVLEGQDFLDSMLA